MVHLGAAYRGATGRDPGGDDVVEVAVLGRCDVIEFAVLGRWDVVEVPVLGLYEDGDVVALARPRGRTGKSLSVSPLFRKTPLVPEGMGNVSTRAV